MATTSTQVSILSTITVLMLAKPSSLRVSERAHAGKGNGKGDDDLPARVCAPGVHGRRGASPT